MKDPGLRPRRVCAERDDEELCVLASCMRALAPPPRTHANVALEDAIGETIAAHHGEATQSVTNVMTAAAADREAPFALLQSL